MCRVDGVLLQRLPGQGKSRKRDKMSVRKDQIVANGQCRGSKKESNRERLVDGRLKALWRLHGGGRLASSLVGADQAYRKREARLRGCRRRWLSLLLFLRCKGGQRSSAEGSLLMVGFVSRCLASACRTRCLLFGRNPNSVSGRWLRIQAREKKFKMQMHRRRNAEVCPKGEGGGEGKKAGR